MRDSCWAPSSTSAWPHVVTWSQARPPYAVPEHGYCASSARAGRLWAARHSQEQRPGR